MYNLFDNMYNLFDDMLIMAKHSLNISYSRSWYNITCSFLNQKTCINTHNSTYNYMGQSISTIMHHIRKPQFDFLGIFRKIRESQVVKLSLSSAMDDLGPLLRHNHHQLLIMWKLVIHRRKKMTMILFEWRNIGCSLPHPILCVNETLLCIIERFHK